MNSSLLCPNKKRCGSCKWSHIPYKKQLKQKLADINRSFALHKLNLNISKITPSQIIEHYRNRMDFIINFEGKMGLREKGKWWKVIDGHTCFIADKNIEDAFHLIREWVKTTSLSYYDRKLHKGLLRYAVIRSSMSGEVLVNIITSKTESISFVLNELDNLSKSLQYYNLCWLENNTNSDTSTGMLKKVIAGKDYITEKINGYSYKIKGCDFFQTNSFTAKILQDKVIKNIQDISSYNDKIIDLFCGSGFFTIPLASLGFNTLGIELSESSIKTATENLNINKLEADFIAMDVADIKEDILKDSIIIVDPPRAGLGDKLTAKILKAKPKYINYVSCNFKSFSREMTMLQNNYIVESLEAIDMFPHTPHIELIALLKAKKDYY